MMDRVKARWLGFWFAPSGPQTLGICRILWFSLYPLVVFPFFAEKWPVTPWSAALWPEVSAAWWEPVGFFALLGLEVPSATFLYVGWWLFYISLLTSCIGLLTRPSIVVAFVLNFYLTSITHNLGKINWSWQVPVIVIGALAVAHAGDAFSVDRWLRKRRGADALAKHDALIASRAASGLYTWPIRLVWVFMSMMYLSAGLSKLRIEGFGWLTSDTLAVYLVRANYDKVFVSVNPLTDWGLWIAQQKTLLLLFAIATLIIEMGYPLGMFDWRARLLLVPSALAMHNSIFLLIGAGFPQYQLTALFWVPWGLVWERLIARRAHAPPELSNVADTS